jgi:hypothetical protein
MRRASPSSPPYHWSAVYLVVTGDIPWPCPGLLDHGPVTVPVPPRDPGPFLDHARQRIQLTEPSLKRRAERWIHRPTGRSVSPTRRRVLGRRVQSFAVQRSERAIRDAVWAAYRHTHPVIPAAVRGIGRDGRVLLCLPFRRRGYILPADNPRTHARGAPVGVRPVRGHQYREVPARELVIALSQPFGPGLVATYLRDRSALLIVARRHWVAWADAEPILQQLSRLRVRVVRDWPNPVDFAEDVFRGCRVILAGPPPALLIQVPTHWKRWYQQNQHYFALVAHHVRMTVRPLHGVPLRRATGL